MSTNRLPQQSESIENLLSKHNISFDEYHYKGNGDVINNKINTLKVLKERYPNINTIKIWDNDKKHLETLKKWGVINNVQITYSLDKYSINESENKQDKLIRKYSELINTPYFYDLKSMDVPEEYWEDVLSYKFNQPVTIKGNGVYDQYLSLIHI